MATTCLLDSSVIIDAINERNGRSELLDKLIGEGTLLACCPINVTEVYMGMRPHEAEKTVEFSEARSQGPDCCNRRATGRRSRLSLSMASSIFGGALGMSDPVDSGTATWLDLMNQPQRTRPLPSSSPLATRGC